MKQQRGVDRRHALILAGTRVLESGGPGRFTARAVAAEAAVPLAAVTYYFDTVEELLGLATDGLVAGWLEQGRRVGETFRGGDIAVTAAALTAALLPGPPTSLKSPDSTITSPTLSAATVSTDEQRQILQARYEQLLSAGRSPVVSAALTKVRPAIYDLISAITAQSQENIALSPATILAVIDGAAVGALSEAMPDPVAFIVETLNQALVSATHGTKAD